MNSVDNALFLLAQREHERNNKKGILKNWYKITGRKNRKCVCLLCSKTICNEVATTAKTMYEEELVNEHGKIHLREHGLEDFV